MGEDLARTEFDTARMTGRALDGFTDAADLAERLAAEGQLDYHSAHSLVAAAITAAESRGDSRLSPADYKHHARRSGVDAQPADPRSLFIALAHDGSAGPRRVHASATRLRQHLANRHVWRAEAIHAADESATRLVAETRTASAHPRLRRNMLMTVLQTPDDRFTDLPDYDFTPHFVTVPDARLGDMRMHYLDEGDPDGRTVLLLHGEPAWSFMFRRTVAPLVNAGLRVVVPDLIGFGKSDKPSVQSDYTYESHVRWLTNFVSRLQMRDAVLVGHDWGGLLGLRLVTEVDGLAAAYVATNHGYPTGDMPPNDALREWQKFAAAASEFDVSAIVARACTTPLPADVLSAYDAPYPSDEFKAGARVFPALIPVRPDDPSSDAVRASRAVLSSSAMPFLTVFGEQDPIGGAADGMFQQLVPGATGQPHVRLPDAGHNMPEDAGETLGDIIAGFVESALSSA